MFEEKQNQDDWSEWRQVVFFQLKEQSKDLKDIEKTLIEIQKDLVMLKAKAGIFGAIASLVVGVVWKLVADL